MYHENLKEQKSAIEVNKSILKEIKFEIESNVLEINKVTRHTLSTIEKVRKFNLKIIKIYYIVVDKNIIRPNL